MLSVLLGAAYFLGLPILTLIAWSRGSSQDKQIHKLQQGLKAAEARSTALELRLKDLQRNVDTLREQPIATPPAAPEPLARAMAPSPSVPLAETGEGSTTAPAAHPVAAATQPVTPIILKPEPALPLQRDAEPVASVLRVDLRQDIPLDERPLELLDAPLPSADVVLPWGTPSSAEPPKPLATPTVSAAPSTPAPAFNPELKLEPTAPATPPASTPAAEPHAASVSSTSAPQATPRAVVQPPSTQKPAAQRIPARHLPPRAPRAPAEPSLIERGFKAAKDWLFGGNTIVRVGMLLVFLGLAFLLRYASERVVIPLELRYLAVAATSLVALALGWRLRLKRPDYALLMQGGAVAVMYLTVFAALKLHEQPLLSTEAGFALLVAVVALSGLLAVLQNSLSLAVAGALGGFATPILVSTGGGNHVALFTYFALLNTGILGIAWFKAWRPLNLVGFFGTFLIGLSWGLRSYDPALHFANTEPFLILFFLMFVTIGLLFARRVMLNDPSAPGGRDTAEWSAWFAQKGHAAQRYVDGTILFGTPIVAFSLQVGLIKHIEYGTAFSALALGMFYLVLARFTHSSNPARHRLLTEVFLALGMIFASLAIPLGLDAQWTSAAWAVEAAGIYWIGHRQNRPFARGFALLLQAGATLAFLHKVDAGQETILTGSALGALMLGLSFLSNMLVLRKHVSPERESENWDGSFGPVFSCLGLWSLFAMAPMSYLAEGTATALAIGAFVAVFAALQWRLTGWVYSAVLAHLIALLAYSGTLHQGEGTLISGNLIIALLLGVTLLGNAALLRLHRGAQDNGEFKYNALLPLFGTLGLWVLYLLAPMQFARDYTACAWALASSLTVFLALRLKARGWLANALLVQLVAGGLFLASLQHAEDAVLSGNLDAAILLGITLLTNAALLAKQGTDTTQSPLPPLLSSFGLWSLYLIAPLTLLAEHTAAAWALAGMLTVFVGLKLKARGWLANALLVQLAAGVLFLSHMDRADAGGVLVLAGSGWKGLVIASLIGLASLVSLGTAVREARKQNDPALVKRLAWAMLFGLGFIALAVLFVLPWQTATAVWAACGFVLMWAAMRLNLKPAFWFALALEILAGLAFLKANSAVFFLFGHLPPPEGATPFAHAGFWTPIVIALAAFAVAWRLHAWSRSPAATDADALQVDGDWLSFPALLWSAGWWAFGWWMELRWTAADDQALAHQFLAVMAASVLLLLPIAAKWRWARLAGLCGLLLPLIAQVALFDYEQNTNLLGNLGWAAFGLALIAGFGLLRIAENLLSKGSDRILHLANTWVWLGVAALEMRYVFLTLGEAGSTWRWLGWTLPLAAWLLWNARKTPPKLWPAAAHPQLYRFSATLPLLMILLGWLTLANLQSTGNAAPLPFLPLLNPLDLALVLILFSGWQWLQQLRVQDPAQVAWQPLHTPLQLALLAGSFLTYTCVVLRGVHHLGDIAWSQHALLHSMTVQASLSIAWSLLALGLMISGHRRARRAVWITGAVLIAVVVAKLFFVELSNRGGLERIISFIGVGVLLLVVGYFAPLPPNKDETATSDQP
ncbi:DUF2339 domain-containing protein [Uliginosibacterium flavum]|uniref:DUF2339 domain-containing protein n=1 Tax=Uliginosibacterium flavum TaxID=1396831 RepID=A0ABV2TKF1_9RHOO